ncbi:hypothetical protein [Wolbachia endosymbiont (group A) of Trypoxylon clavicerum]|uniref:hypothetical protein n=1 Tax=Wolbachia endosymbiont (group A) of Trypoxylon clavicerum TaxID=2954064 RepID=UPI00222E0908|nr:hypothetical protein [Wolbachia endosymbiont (group A) of Trypoxylon clavicerum]
MLPRATNCLWHGDASLSNFAMRPLTREVDESFTSVTVVAGGASGFVFKLTGLGGIGGFFVFGWWLGGAAVSGYC